MIDIVLVILDVGSQSSFELPFELKFFLLDRFTHSHALRSRCLQEPGIEVCSLSSIGRNLSFLIRKLFAEVLESLGKLRSRSTAVFLCGFIILYLCPEVFDGPP